MKTETNAPGTALRGPKNIADTVRIGTNANQPQTTQEEVADISDSQGIGSPTPGDSRAVSPLTTRHSPLGLGLGSIAALVLLWWGVTWLGNYPAFILPTPVAVAARMRDMLLDGSLLGHAWTTTREAGLGFLAAFVVGTSLGYLIGHSHLLERVLSPYIAVSQGLPVVALAPLLVIWFRDDLLREVVIVALIVFFPILVNTVVAVRGIDRTMLEVARIYGANFFQTLYYVEVPLGLRALLGGVKLGLTLAITGAVVGELVSSQSGLGFLLSLGRGLFDTTLVFVGLVSLAILALAAYTLVTLLEKVLITWET